MNREFISAENSESAWKMTCTSQAAEQNCSRRKARLWRIRSEKRKTRLCFSTSFSASSLLLQRYAVVRRQHSPSVPNSHPNIGQPVMVLVGLAVGASGLVISPGHDRNIATPHSYPQIREFGDFDFRRRIGAVRDVPGLTVDVAVLDRDHELFGQQRRQNIDFPFLVRFRPFLLKLAHLRCRSGVLLRSNANRTQKKHAEREPRCHPDPHGLYGTPIPPPLTSA